MNAGQIEQMLCDRAQDVVMHLFPSAKIVNGEAKVGDISGRPGESLSIRVSGSKIGSWADFSADLKGRKLIGLWHTVRGLPPKDFPKTLEEATKWLGVYQPRQSDVRTAPAPRVEPARPDNDIRPLLVGSTVQSYLTMERELSMKTLELYGVCENNRSDVIFFPFKDGSGSRLQMGKYLALKRDERGKKKSWTTANATKNLFGKHVVPANGGDLYITEGEVDAMSMHEMGYPAVSVPYGAKWEGVDGKDPNDEWIANDFEWLECFTRIFLCLDDDEEGKKATASIIKRLGQERCYVMKMPDGCKDANDVLVKGRQPDFFEALENAETVDPVELKSAEKFREQVWERLNPQTREERGIPFILDIPWRNRRGELTIWTGFSGHGKSEFLNCYMIYLASLHEKCCIASFEMPAADTLHNMTLQASGRSEFLHREDFDKDYSWLADKVWVVDRVGRFSWRDMLEIFRYCRRRYGTTQFVVDSLMRCNIEEDDYQQQKDFVDALSLFAMESDSHVHLVAHSRKRENEEVAPGKLDVSGTAKITDLAHNVATVHRNKSKEAKLDEFRIQGMQPTPDVSCLPDGFLKVHKQRTTGDEPKAAFFFIKAVRQFTQRREMSVRYVRHPDEMV